MFRKLAGLTAVAGLFIAGTVSAQSIEGTAHDFSQAGAFNSGGEICIACHTTHNTDTNVSTAPLWNHALTAETGFTPYDSGTLNATIGNTVTGISRLCLSCHDGTVALDSFGGNTGTQFISGGANVGNGTKDLTDDHPIAFTYDAALATADGELADPTNTASGLGDNINIDLLFGAGNDQLECASCHDVHNNVNGSFLVLANANSALCQTCHNK